MFKKLYPEALSNSEYYASSLAAEWSNAIMNIHYRYSVVFDEIRGRASSSNGNDVRPIISSWFNEVTAVLELFFYTLELEFDELRVAEWSFGEEVQLYEFLCVFCNQVIRAEDGANRLPEFIPSQKSVLENHSIRNELYRVIVREDKALFDGFPSGQLTLYNTILRGNISEF